MQVVDGVFVACMSNKDETAHVAERNSVWCAKVTFWAQCCLQVRSEECAVIVVNRQIMGPYVLIQ